MSVPILQSSLRFRIRFSEIDAMRVVWHGAYAKYFEDAREQFGKDFGLDYLMIERNGFYAPIVDLSFQYKQPLRYGMEPEIVITYRPTEAAKIVFDYEIRGTNGEGVFVIPSTNWYGRIQISMKNGSAGGVSLCKRISRK